MTTVAERQTMTAERYAQGKTWEQYRDSINANKAKFAQNYDTYVPKAEHVEFLKAFAARKGLNVVCIGEDWCPDVVRGLPTVAKTCAVAGLPFKVFERDQHMDLTNEFLWRHKFMCVPIFVFYDKDWNELGHWTEKPASAYKWTADLRTELRTAGLKDEEVLPVLRERRAGVEMDWQHDTIREICEQILWRVL